jgi:hypothetical protein
MSTERSENLTLDENGKFRGWSTGNLAREIADQMDGRKNQAGGVVL